MTEQEKVTKWLNKIVKAHKTLCNNKFFSKDKYYDITLAGVQDEGIQIYNGIEKIARVLDIPLDVEVLEDEDWEDFDEKLSIVYDGIKIFQLDRDCYE